MGLSAEEKIKILYEDSLTDIRELTAKLESVTALFEQTQTSLSTTISTLPGAADKEMRRAGTEIISGLSGEVGKIAQRLAGDAVLAEKNRAISMAVIALCASALIFGVTGYMIRMLADKWMINAAQAELRLANSRADTAIANAEKRASMEIEVIRKNSGWVGTENGRLAKKFFDSGAGKVAAHCDSPVWEIVETENGKFCVPLRRPIFGGGPEQYGWKIP